jgi:hypothetical protein
LTTRLERTVLSEKIIDDDLSRVKENATKSIYKLGLRRMQPNPYTNWGLSLRYMRKRMKRVLLSLFIAPATIKKRKYSNQPKPTTHPIQRHPSTSREK